MCSRSVDAQEMVRDDRNYHGRGGFSSLGKYQRGEEDVISDFNTNPVFLKIPYLTGKGPYPPVSTSLVNTTLAK